MRIVFDDIKESLAPNFKTSFLTAFPILISLPSPMLIVGSKQKQTA